MRAFDPQIIRRDFPILHQNVNGRPLVWLDNGATTQKPQSVIDRISYFYENENSNIHRGAHTLAARSTDAYEGAPTPVMAFLSVGSKAAAVGALAALFLGPLDPLRSRLDVFFAAAAVLTMSLGNLGAMRQRGLRRFIAYSSIAQAGYMLMALAGDGDSARPALLFNLAVYGVTGFALFFVISIVGRDRPETMDSLRGLSRRSPGLAALLALSMFSLAGIPPLAGFLGKFLIFSSAAKAGEPHSRSATSITFRIVNPPSPHRARA